MSAPVRIGRKHDAVQNYGGCAVQTIYTETWGPSCSVSMLEAVAADQTIMDSCPGSQAGTVGGSRLLRKMGDCGRQMGLIWCSRYGSESRVT